MVLTASNNDRHASLETSAFENASLGSARTKLELLLAHDPFEAVMSGRGNLDVPISRRAAIRIGGSLLAGLSAMGLSPVDALGADPLAPSRGITPVIHVHLRGGVPSKEWLAPVSKGVTTELKNFFDPVPTGVCGVHFSSIWPELARQFGARSFSFCRALASHSNFHDVAVKSLFARPGGRTLATELARIKSSPGSLPGIFMCTSSFRDDAEVGLTSGMFLEPKRGKHGGFSNPVPDGSPDLTKERLALPNQLDRRAPSGNASVRFLAHRSMAVDLMTSGGPLLSAFSPAPESRTRYDATRRRYGENDIGAQLHISSELARMGVPYTLNYVGYWDFHADLPTAMPELAAQTDRALSALISEIARGDLNAVLVVTTEFNRTPRQVFGGTGFSARGSGGRDHHLEGVVAMFAGGRTAGGIAHGEMDGRGEQPLNGRLPFGPELFNTIIHLAGGGHLLRPGSAYIHELVRR